MATDNIDFANNEFSYSNVSSITTNFDVAPYYDDFDDSKNYYRILFKPGYAVQARELTQIQSILQDQIQKFGQHVFKEGSMVLGGKFFIDTRAHYVKVKDTDSFGNPVDISLFQGEIVTGQATGITAYVNIVLDGVESTDTPKTLYVSYLSGNPDTDEVYFTPNEPLVSNVGTLIVANTTPAVGYGSVFTLSEGVRFCKQHFIHHDKQAIVIDRYDIHPTCRVGFALEESIVDSTQDTTLLDPALESSNFSAPGADRFKITPVLTKLDIDDVSGFPDYVNLFEIDNGKVTEINERPTYNVIRDEIAKRTYDESGDYYVRGFNVVLEEHLNNGSNGGRYTLDEGGDYSKLSVQVEPGTAYVKGYEVNKQVTSYITTDKAVDFGNVSSQIISSPIGSYIIVKEAVGAWNINSGQQIDLYNTAMNRISTGASSIAGPTGSKIGTARLLSMSINDGTIGTANGTLRLHIGDVNMLGSNSFASVRSVYYNNSTTADLGADLVLSGNNAIINDTFRPLLYYVGTPYTKTIRTVDGSVDTQYFFKKTSDVSIDSSGNFTLSSTVSNEIFPYGTGTVSSADVQDIFLTLNSNVSISIPGTASSGAGTTNVGGSVASKFTRLNVGDRVLFSGNSMLYSITSITSDVAMTVDKNLPSSFSGNTFTKVYLAGDMIDMRGKGVDAGATRVVTSAPTSLSFALNETFGTTVSGTVTYTMGRTNAREIKKTLKPDRYVTIDCSSHSTGANGPFSLGFSDLYRIKSIRKDTSSFTTSTQGTDVTDSFLIDNGQRDDSYTNARILPKITLSTSDKLLVCLDYFQPDFTLGLGYFSVDSYSVNDVDPISSEIPTTGIPFFTSGITGYTYDLRNYLDFRPVFTNTAADSTTIAGATANPTASTTLQYESSGLRLPADSQPITYSFSYYWARRDVVAMDINGGFHVIRGVPADGPITPQCPSSLMSLAKLYIKPYPSLSTTYARQLGRSDLASGTTRTAQVRFTMKDIGVLKQRVDNIENYVSLSLLEKNALDMKILDANGLDRFKNGIFVDSFTSFATSDISNPDHHICYDPKEGSIRPLAETHAIGYNLVSNTNVVKTDSLLMLPYTETVAVEQPYATTIKNVETNVYRFVGKLYLDPDNDYWVNTNRLASQTYNFGSTLADVTPYSVVYGSWQTVVTGITSSSTILKSTISSTSTATSSSTKHYILSFAGAASIGGSGAVGVGTGAVVSDIDSLIAMYGASTPITASGVSLGGTQTLAAGKVIAAFNNIHTLGDIKDNAALLKEINNFQVSITTTAGGGTTTTSNTYSAVTTTGTQATRNFTETFQSLQTETQSMGDKVVSVAPIADIRPQTIAFEAIGVKASTKHYVYFDGQLMTPYVTPGQVASIPSNLGNNMFFDLITPTGSEGSALYSDSSGHIVGFLRLPSDESRTFRTGTKTFVVTDSPTNEADATSSATAYFAAQGINQSVQEDILSTGHVVTTTKNGVQTEPVVYTTTSNTYTTNTSTTTSGTVSGVMKDVISCMAYSFKLATPTGEEGTFLTSVDVFFSDKDPNLGVWFEIRAMDNAGNITKTQVPYSEVWLSSSQVNTSTDGSVATNVRFKNPVFLQNNQEYAFVIHTVGINPNYYMYVCVLGEKDILLQTPINNRPLTGTLYLTNNNTDWNPIMRTDLKIRFNRAVFDTTVVGEAVIGNEQREYVKLPLSVATGANTSWFGEKIRGNDTLVLSAPVGGTIGVGDYLIGGTSTTNTTVTSIDGSTHIMSSGGYVASESLTVMRANGLATPITSTVVSQNAATGKIYTILPKNNPDLSTMHSNSVLMIIKDSNGFFAANNILSGVMSSNTVTVNDLSKYVYSTVQFEPNHIDFSKTTMVFSMATVSNTGVSSGYSAVTESIPLDFDEEKAIYSRTTELANFAGSPSNKVKIQMSTTSDYLSPVVDLTRTYSVYIHNLINSNTAYELIPYGGMLTDKYISQVITQADGQEAEDLQIYLTAYRPPGSNSDIKVYARISNSEDMESIYSRNWVELETSGSGVYSALNNRKDWREYMYKFPDAYMVGVNDQDTPILGYTNGANTTFSGFSQYQIKIGLQSDNSAIFPRVADLRCIALQA